MLKIGVCDDQPESAALLRRNIDTYLARHGIPGKVYVYHSPYEMFAARWKEFEIIFLDVVMREMNGIKAAQKIRSENANTVLIFVSAFLDYATEGYQVKATAYLLKNDMENTFNEAMDDALESLGSREPALEMHATGGKRQMLLSRIWYLESFKRTVQINGDPALRFNEKISDLEHKLSNSGFLRIHKSYLVNLDHCMAIKNYRAVLDNGRLIPCSRQNYAQLVQALLHWKGQFK
ncbi:MAG: LytTR family DNA-binding domain-containing protein [Intestinimonas sp.]|jgi:DNA-binding LytR/AlgR family response regulator|nr:LytTR family DNA-binding domain-containing protein [Intestinimonas sp.]